MSPMLFSLTQSALVQQSSSSSKTVEDALGALQPILQYGGTIAFAISGALVALRHRMDVVGVVLLGAIVAVGGGTIRDLLLQNPIFWIQSPAFVIVGALTALATIPLANSGTIKALEQYNLISMTDAAGLALFVITGTNVALSAGANNFTAAIIGVISGIGGGIIRDILANKIPGVLTNTQLYAAAAFAGAILYVLLLQTSLSPLVSVWIPIILIFVLRALSILRGWGVPKFRLKRKEDPQL
jgi:uncharacterized membrane protein YeiH